jgi:hypothetical protein
MDVLIDYLTVSIKTINYIDILEKMMIEENECTHRFSRYGRYGMLGCLFFNGISLHYGAYCILEMSGGGCRTLETLQGDDFDWKAFIFYLMTGEGHISRLDIACDDNLDDEPKLDMLLMIRHAVEKRYISNAQYVTFEGGSREEVQAGSPKSDKLLRIYNKAMERGYGPERHWIRCELQLRNDKAYQFWLHWAVEGMPIGEVLTGTLIKFFRFTDECYLGKHASRLNVCIWWSSFLEDAEKLFDLKIGGLIYNELSADRYLRVQASSTIKTYLALNGGDISPIIEMSQDAKLNEKQKMLLFQKGVKL